MATEHLLGHACSHSAGKQSRGFLLLLCGDMWRQELKNRASRRDRKIKQQRKLVKLCVEIKSGNALDTSGTWDDIAPKPNEGCTLSWVELNNRE